MERRQDGMKRILASVVLAGFVFTAGCKCLSAGGKGGCCKEGPKKECSAKEGGEKKGCSVEMKAECSKCPAGQCTCK
jgi:hypothetical protein